MMMEENYEVTLMNICACVVNYRNIMTTLEMLMDRRKRSVHRQRSKSSSQPFDQLNDSSAVQTFKGGKEEYCWLVDTTHGGGGTTMQKLLDIGWTWGQHVVNVYGKHGFGAGQ
ncbi:hypothetical protein CK203_045817 [Vitis vinifera]|uniref:Uncharacterized protein n=1 Tax=Vitis vinifera TaxID=29760 RepID=A0A438FM45_VITVI|nr:hypothetical protein CK203_045817 [Vitis vinifera]